MLERGLFGGGNRLGFLEKGASMVGKRSKFGSKKGGLGWSNRVSFVVEKNNFDDKKGKFDGRIRQI